MAVLVWIHGGGNVDGESNDYDGSKLATRGALGTPTVVVTINYRLNLFGFLAHPALDSEGHLFANYGILDQQAAPHWVQRNIAAFGGAPPGSRAHPRKGRPSRPFFLSAPPCLDGLCDQFVDA
jgi:para-nitrobenzyl esterase